MSNRQDGGNVIHIIGGGKADNQDDKPVASTWCDYGEGSAAATLNLAYGGNEALVSESSQFPKIGSSSFVMVEDGRSSKLRHCNQFNSEAGCPYGDNCVFIHDERVTIRESLAVIVAPGSRGGHLSQAVTGATAPLALAPLPVPTRPLTAAATGTATPSLAQLPLVVQTVSSGTVRPLYYRTRICSKWKQTGYCHYGSNCYFAHGEAELQRYGVGGPGESEANPINQRAVVQNLPAAYRSFPAPFVRAAAPAATASAAKAGGSGQMAGAVQGPIPSRNAWKVPKKINGVYGDWIDGHDIE